jgi:hypothetical protein
MVSDLVFYQLMLVALLWLCVMLLWVWPSDSAAACPPGAHTLCGLHYQAALRRL